MLRLLESSIRALLRGEDVTGVLHNKSDPKRIVTAALLGQPEAPTWFPNRNFGRALPVLAAVT